MNDTVATKAQDTLTYAKSSELVVVIGTRTVEYHQGQRSYTAPTGRTYDRSRPKRSERRKSLAKRPQAPPNWGLPGWPQAERFFGEANAENQRGTTRGIVLVWANMIDEMLGSILEGFFIDNAKSRTLIWEDSHSSLGTFSGRGKLAFCLGLIGKQEYDMFEDIRSIRNIAAHQWDLSPDNPAYTKLLNALKRIHSKMEPRLIVFQESDLELMVKLVFGGSCVSLALKLGARQTEAVAERRVVKPDANGTT